MKIIGLEQKYIEAVELEKQQLEIAFDGEVEFCKGDQLRVYKDGEKVVVEKPNTFFKVSEDDGIDVPVFLRKNQE